MGDLQRVTRPPNRGLKLAAARSSALLSLLFIVVYPLTNWITSRRSDVGTWYFEWELGAPFVPLMVIPYLSIDLFFVPAPFLCGDRAELRTLARRITFGILTAGAFFLLMPLELGFTRPHLEGWLGALYNPFVQADKPHNLFPSLHITLRTILADLYTRHTRGASRALLHIWFSLVGLSTFLTYQHHLVDIAGGFLLAAFCFYLFPLAEYRSIVIPNRRAGTYYALAAMVVALLGIPIWPWGSFLLWPAAGLAIMAAAYWRLGPGIFRKRDGVLPLSTLIVLGPVLLGQWLSLRFYRRRCRPWDVVTPGVWIGSKLSTREARTAVQRGATAVLDLSGEFSEAAPFLKIRYLSLPILDLTAPSLKQLHTAVAYIEEHSRRSAVYVHCKIGFSRSAAVVGAYLLASGEARTSDEAVGMLRSVRPQIVVRPEILAALNAFEKDLRRPA